MSAALKTSSRTEIRAAPTAADRICELADRIGSEYFRARLINNEPRLVSLSQKRVVLATNHSGMAFPWDGIVMYPLMSGLLGGKEHCRFLVSPILFGSRIMSPYLMNRFWSYFCEPATRENFEEMMKQNQNVLICPEGVPGLAKGFGRKYQLQRFSSSMIHICLKYDRPLIPVSTVNAEYLHPHAYGSNLINRLAMKMGIPFVPFGPMTIPFLLFPFIFYMALPARLTYVIGEAIDLKKMVGPKPVEELSAEDIRRLTDQVHDLMQVRLNADVERYGRKPYEMKSFWPTYFKSWRSVIRMNPIAWPFRFHAAFLGPTPRQRDRFQSLLMCLALSLPLVGWIFVLVAMAAFPFRSRHRKSWRHENAD